MLYLMWANSLLKMDGKEKSKWDWDVHTHTHTLVSLRATAVQLHTKALFSFDLHGRQL